MSVKEAYAQTLAAHGHSTDDAQLRVVKRLADLQERLEAADSPGRRLLDLLPGRQSRTDGLYLWGDVGRGKTFLMDIFYRSLNVDKKKRIHFHRMMHDVHARLKNLHDIEDPLDQVAADIAAETRVLCFDEFYVSDIGDAMILGRLLEGLFDRGVTLIATSNAKPADLYKDGLQRERFLPAIAMLEDHTRVVEMDGGTDFRLELLQRSGTYIHPLGEQAEQKLSHYFERIAAGHSIDRHVLTILGRSIATRRCAKGIAWFDFEAICDGPRSQEDYIEIARWYPTVIVSDIPQMDGTLENPARRFIALIDEFYDRRVKLIVTAATDIDALYVGQRLQFEFQRTASRLSEMQSDDYLHAAHRP